MVIVSSYTFLLLICGFGFYQLVFGGSDKPQENPPPARLWSGGS